MRVLLVEDHLELGREIQRLVQAISGVQSVRVYSSGKEAVRWLAETPAGWDLLLVDLFLIDGNGFDVLHGCRHRSPHQKVAVLTNYAKEHVREYALAAGADAFFDKSFDMDAVVAFCAAHARRCASLLPGRLP